LRALEPWLEAIGRPRAPGQPLHPELVPLTAAAEPEAMRPLVAERAPEPA
jgi:hypothetical protein